LVFLQFLLARGGSVWGSQTGEHAFQALAWVAFLSSTLGFVLTADSVSVERREGTLGLLLLTRVDELDVLVGKLVSAGLSAGLGLLAITPALMLPLLAGGVRWTQVAWVALSLPGLLFMSLSAGLWASSQLHQRGRALSRAAAGTIVVVVAPWLLGALQPHFALFLTSLSPASAFFWGIWQPTRMPHPSYWISVFAGFAWGGLLLLLAARHLHRHWNEETEAPRSAPDEIRRTRRVLAEEPPLRWLLGRSAAQKWVIWPGAALVLLPAAVTALLARGIVVGGWGLLAGLSLVSAIGSGLLFAYAGAGFFLQGRGSGELELLRTTPVGAARLVADQWWVLRRRLTDPLVAVVAIHLLVSAGTLGRLRGLGTGLEMIPEVSHIIGKVVDAIALGWLGMWFGYRARNTCSALLWPVGLVTGFDWVLGIVSVKWAFMLPGLYPPGPSWPVGVVLLFLLLIAKQLWLIRWARRRLQRALGGVTLEAKAPPGTA
jgi:hypothetical protein